MTLHILALVHSGQIKWQKLFEINCVSEHVSFHKQLRMLGAELYIHPGLINWDTRFFGNALPLGLAIGGTFILTN